MHQGMDNAIRHLCNRERYLVVRHGFSADDHTDQQLVSTRHQ